MTEPARTTAPRRKPQDRKPKATETESSRTVTVQGIKVTVNLDLLRSPRTLDDIGVIQEASERPDDKELLGEAALRLPGLLRRLIGLPGSRQMHAALEKKHGTAYGLQHVTGFLVDLIKASAPNS